MAIFRKHLRPMSLTTACLVSLLLSAIPVHASTDIVLYAAKAPVRAGTWAVVSDPTAAGGFAIANPNLGAPKLLTPLATPVNYFEMTFPAYSGQAYHLWFRGKAAGNSYDNDSVYVQFSDSVTSSGTAVDRIGTTSGVAVVLQSCTGALEQSWGWADNGWCGLGTDIYFQTTGNHTIRVQLREDGLSIDQIVLSPQTYLSTAPGARVGDKSILVANLPTVNVAPLVSISPSPSSGSAPLSVSFNPTVTSTNGSISSYQWQFGDGQTSTETNPSHTFQNAGNYTPKLTVMDTSGSMGSAASLITVSGTSSGTKFRVVEANISYGGHGTDNIINLNRTTDWLVKMNPDAASLVEVIGGYKDPSLITGLMKQKTGLTWYSYYVPKYSGCPEGVMILSKWPIVSTAQYFMSYQMPIAEATLSVNGKLISFFATHFQWPENASSERQVEANELVSFASKFPEPRIIGGDFNAQVGTPEVNIVLQKYYGGWDTAVSKTIAAAYPDNPSSIYTRTRRSRIDHVFYSKGTTAVSVTGGDVPDQRAPGTAALVVVKIGTADDKGVRPSDHNFMSITFNVN